MDKKKVLFAFRMINDDIIEIVDHSKKNNGGSVSKNLGAVFSDIKKEVGSIEDLKILLKDDHGQYFQIMAKDTDFFGMLPLMTTKLDQALAILDESNKRFKKYGAMYTEITNFLKDTLVSETDRSGVQHNFILIIENYTNTSSNETCIMLTNKQTNEAIHTLDHLLFDIKNGNNYANNKITKH